jgi:hypothetical protein
LASIRFHWAPLALAALIVQVVQFDPVVGGALGDLGPAIYVASTAVVLGVVMRNLRLTGLPIVAGGAAANLAAIVANGGFMPTSREALAVAGLEPTEGPSNSIVLDSPALAPLTDVFALPSGVPLANVFSIGDVLIAVGVALAIAAAMRSTPRRQPDPEPVA